MKRVWFTHGTTGKVAYFPQPIVSKHRWRPLFIQLCDRHRIELLRNGSVAQRGFSDALALLLTRTDALLPAAGDVSRDSPIYVSAGWDALRHAGRHITHGGLKVASFKPDIASFQSEMNFVSSSVWRDNDDHAGLMRGLSEWAPEFNAAKRKRTFSRLRTAVPHPPTAGALPIGTSERTRVEGRDPRLDLPRQSYDLDYAVTLDLSAVRSIRARTKGCASRVR